VTTTPDSTPGGAPPPAPVGARYDPVTGADLLAGGNERRQSFALQPGEPVNSFNVVTSLMPLASGSAPQTYRWALGLGLLIPVIAGALGFLAFAFVAAALVVPAIYIVYMYDVNEWEDQPIAVVLGAVALAAALGVGWTFAWHAGILSGELIPVDGGEGAGGVEWTSLVVLVLLVPVVSLALMQVGPLVLATRPQFDDMIDALTFGVASGAAFAAAETIVVNRGLFSSFGHIDNANAGFWVSLILSAAIVKPIVYGAAAGIALAAWSGLGAGYDGFKPGYIRGVAEALAALIVFQGGLYFAARLEGTTGAVVGLVWGALIAAVLVIRLRYLLHFAVLEAALEASATGQAMKDSARGAAYCPSCEMPLPEGANFCVACGTSTRAGSKVTRVRNRTDDAEAALAKPTLASTPGGQAPRDNKKTALVVGAVAAVLVLGGVVGQAAAAAAADEPELENPVTIDPNIDSGPQTEDPPDPADAPGPAPDESVEPSEESTEGLGSSLGGISAAGEFAPGVGVRLDGTGGGTTTTTGSFVELVGGVGFELPSGFEIIAQQPGFAQVFGEGGHFIAYLTPPQTSVEVLIGNHLQGLTQLGIQDLQISEPTQVQLPTSAVVQAYSLNYVGVLATQQGGTIPVQGFAYYFLRQDGSGVTAFGLFEQGWIDSEDHPLLIAYNQMMNSLVGTL
jgi:hypothetical protein